MRITWLAALLLPVWGCGARSTDAPGRGPKESGSAAIAAAAKTACIPEGSKFFAKSKVEACCSGLVGAIIARMTIRRGAAQNPPRRPI